MTRVLIAGYYGFGNLGDEAILSGLVLGFGRHLPDGQLTVVSGDPARTRIEHPTTSSVEWRDWPGLIAEARQVDLVVLGGGGLFQDYWEVDPGSLLSPEAAGLAYYASIPLLAYLVGAPCQVLAVGIGPLTTEAGRRATATALRWAQHISVRDPASLEVLSSLESGGGLKADLAADLSLLIEAAPRAEVDEYLRARGVPTAEDLVAVNLRYWKFGVDPEIWPGEVGGGLDRLASTDDHLLLLPFQSESTGPFEDDVDVLRRAQAAIARPQRTTLLTEVPSPEIMLGILGRCRAALVMRLHAAVFAVRQGLPTLALGYDPKVRQWMKDMGRGEHVLLPEAWTGEALARAWQRLPDRRGSPPDLRGDLARLDRVFAQSPVLARSRRTAADPSDEAIREFALAKVQQLAEARQALGEARAEREAAEADRAALAVEVRSARQAMAEASEERDDARRSLAVQTIRAQEAERRAAGTQAELAERSQELTEARQALAHEHGRLAEWRERLLSQIAGRQRERESLQSELEAAQARLSEIHASRGWRLVRLLWRVRLALAAHGSLQARLIRGGLARLRGASPPAPSPTHAISRSAPSLFPYWWSTAVDRDEHLLRTRIFLERELPRSEGQVVVIFSAVPLVLSEGQRATGLARAFTQLGVPVIFAAWRWFPRDLPSDLSDRGPLLQIPLDTLVTQAEHILQVTAPHPIQGTFLVEFPHPSLFRVLNLAGAHGWTTVYDAIDDWEAFHQVGQAIWYDPAFERYLVHNVDHVLATSPALADKMRGFGARRVPLLGNAYEGESFGPSASRKDLPCGDITIGYFGHLTRSWFDWETVYRVAASRPRWSFHIIGYGDHPEAAPPDNVLLLGKVPHGELPEYAANWDVGLIPFRPGKVSRAVDPVKVYEYLALGLPVVTQGMPHLETVPGVRNASSAESMAALIEQAARSEVDREAVREFLGRNTWPQRARAILALGPQPSLNPLWRIQAQTAGHG